MMRQAMLATGQTTATSVRVSQTVGNRSGLSGPVPIWSGIKSVQIQNLNLNLKNKKFLKILQGATNLMVSNFSQKFVHLV